MNPATKLVAAFTAALTTAAPQTAAAFCGFYVGGADTKLYNNATQVVLMREGQRTVLSMQNNYQGPPADFAMVVPVPVVLQKDDVKTLPKAVFDRIDQLAAPRLVEYWEQDPCPPRERRRPGRRLRYMEGAPPPADRMESGGSFGVRIEAKFEVGEYQVVILSAEDSSGLDAWLRLNKYSIPAGAAEVLRPYVQAGMKFFVAKVDVTKVNFNAQGQAMLSPLRFHYDSDNFALPVRLGLLNAQGKQDLIVHILARNTRYEAANYVNVAIPTNIEVADATRSGFGAFYASLFDRVLARYPGAVVTEYAWASSSCDPCPTPPLEPAEVTLLGGDVAGLGDQAYDLVLTRLHARYGAETLGEDLVFRAAQPIWGGRETGGPEANERGALLGSYNNFQARYIIRHPWEGPIKCRSPIRGVWGGPPGGGGPSSEAARDLAFVARDQPLTGFLRGALADSTRLPGEAQEIDPYPPKPAAEPAAEPLDPGPANPPSAAPAAAPAGCARCDVQPGTGALALAGLALVALGRRRRARI